MNLSEFNPTFEDKLRLVTGHGAWHTWSGDGRYPELLMTDGPHGLRKQDEGERENNKSVRATCFPAACAIAAGWDPSLAAIMARSIAKEAKTEGVGIVLGPGVNIKRSPTCGRNFEYYSEDPFLSGKLAAAYINAMQSEGVGTSLKHFAANNQESFRMSGDSRVDVRALREIYLSAFEIAVKEAEPATVMASYNRINGVYSCENKWLLTDVLRKEWGYKGTVISDWGACSRLPESVEAGMDLEMPDSCGNHIKKLKEAVLDERVSREALDRAVSNVLKLSSKYSRKIENLSSFDKDILLKKNHETAVEIEKQCGVLLKNNGVLPLNPEKNLRLLIIGKMAEKVRIQGGGSSHINTDDVVSIPKAFEKEGFECEYIAGYLTESTNRDEKMEQEALEGAKKAVEEGIPVIFCGGLTDLAEGEGYDRTSFDMPQNQACLLKKICEITSDVVFAAFGGSPFDLSPADKAGAVLLMYLGGEGVSEAAAGLISGRENPSGKLPETFPVRLEDTPCFHNFGAKKRNAHYTESLLVGYRYYDTFNIDVKYPFGHGLSYTKFEYSDIEVKKTGEGAEVSFSIKNVGNLEGKEIAQIYVRNPKDVFLRAARELRGFEKVSLKPGESKRVSVGIVDRSFEVFDEKTDKYVTIPGEYTVEVGASIKDIRLSKEIVIEGEKPLIEQKSISLSEVKDSEDIIKGEYTIQNSLSQLSKSSLLGKIVLFFAIRAGYSMNKGKRKDDPEVMMFIEGIREGNLDCVMINADGILPYRLGEAIVLSANGHKLKAFRKMLKE